MSRNSVSGKDRAISSSIASRPAMATSISRAPGLTLSRIAAPPTSAIRAPSLINAISSFDLIIRSDIAASAMSIKSRGPSISSSRLREAIVRLSSSTPRRFDWPTRLPTARQKFPFRQSVKIRLSPTDLRQGWPASRFADRVVHASQVTTHP